MENIIIALQNELQQCSNPEYRKISERFFKEPVSVRGMKSAMVIEIGKKYFKLLPDKSKNHVFDLCDELWLSGFMEDTAIVNQWAYACRKQFEPSDMKRFEHWVNTYLNNWASCDGLCNQTIGSLIEMYPEHLQTLKEWTRSANRWTKRASAVSLIVPARKGLFLDDVFEIASLLLHDPDDMVQKGYGWMLKVASNKHQQEVFDFVIQNKTTMPRTSLRYAIEKMPEKLKKEAMAK